MSKEKKPTGFDFSRSFDTNKDLESNGAWDSLYMDGQELKVKVARKNNPHYKKMLRDAMTRNKRKLERETQDAVDLFERIMVKVMAKTILLDWGELIINGEAAEYSIANAELVLSNEDFRKEIDAISETFDLYKQKQDEEIRKN